MSNKIKIFWIFPIVVISLITGYLTTQGYFYDFDYTINLIDLLSLIATIYVGIFIAKKIENSRVEKDLVIELIKSTIQQSKIISEQVETNIMNFNTIKSELKKLSILLSDLEEYQKICNLESDSENLKIMFLNLKRLITVNSPEVGFITLSLGSHQTAKKEIKTLITTLLKCLVETNRN